MTTEWSEAAQRYRLMTERAQLDLWNQLSPAEREALSEALNSTPANPSEAELSVVSEVHERGDVDTADSKKEPRRKGCFGPFFFGCTGVILGVVLTIGAEVALVMMGVQAVSDVLQGAPDDPGAAGLDHLSDQDLYIYCGTKWEGEYSRIQDVCAMKRSMDILDYRMYKERTGQVRRY